MATKGWPVSDFAEAGDLSYPSKDLLQGEGGKRSNTTGEAKTASKIAHPLILPKTASEKALKASSIPSRFSQPAWDEAARAAAVRPDPSHPHRTDYRWADFVTVDPDDAKDFDDAVAAYCLSSGRTLLLVAVADVAEFVPLGSHLDQAAFTRAETAYFPDLTMPMLPPALSEDACSLRPDVDRNAVVCAMLIAPDGQILLHWFEEAVIRSRGRLTYEQAEPLLKGEFSGDVGIDRSMACLAGVHRSLLADRRRRRALSFSPTERRILMDGKGAMTGVRQEAETPPHSMIEEAMVAANRCAAELLRRNGAPAPHRGHQPPDHNDLTDLRLRLTALTRDGRLKVKLRRRSSSEIAADIEHAVRAAKRGGADRWLCEDAVKRTLPKAGYTLRADGGHFGLGVPCYAHFTSPIRRYADVLVHRAIKATLRGLPPSGIDVSVCAALNARGVAVAKAVRSAEDAVLCQWFMQRSPWREQAMPGTVSGIADFGAFISFDGDWGVDGLAHVTRLGGHDWIETGLERPHEMFEEMSGRRVIGLGDRVNARVDSIDAATGRISIGWVGLLAERPRSQHGSRRPPNSL